MKRKKLANRKGGATAPPVILAKRYVIDGYSARDSQLIGVELAKIANANRTDVASLDKALVYALIERDDRHPLRPLCDWDDAHAARAYRINQIGEWIRGLYTVEVGPRGPTKVSEFVHAKPTALYAANKPQRRGYVLTDDALANDPVFMNVIGGRIRNVQGAVKGLADFARRGDPPQDVADLIVELEAALEKYFKGVRLSRVS